MLLKICQVLFFGLIGLFFFHISFPYLDILVGISGVALAIVIAVS
jgi:hypothetical protein